MVHCEFCGKEIGYLPFKCKYCGSIYCKVHRLPENHACSFDKKHVPTTPTPDRSEESEQRSYKPIKSSGPQSIDKLLGRQRKRQRRSRNIFNQNRGQGGIYSFSMATYLILGIFVASIVALFIPQFTCLSYDSFFSLFLWTFLTAPFVYYTTGFGIFILFFVIFLFYSIIKIIELRFGSRFLLGLYLFSTLVSGLVFFIILILVQNLIPVQGIYIGLAYSGLMGIISFIIFPNVNQKMTFLLFFIPIRMKGRTILIVLILFRLIFILFNIFPLSNLLASLLFYLPDLGGILGSYIVFRYKSTQRDRFY